MRQAFVILGFLFSFAAQLAFCESNKKRNSPDSKIVFKSVLARYRKLGNWKAKFTQENYSPGLGKGSFNEGQFSYVRTSRGEKFRYSLEGPEFSDFISNGKEAWQLLYRQGRNKPAEVKHFRTLKNIDLSRYLIFFRGFFKNQSEAKDFEKTFKVDGNIQGEIVTLFIEPKIESDIAKIELVFENHVEAPKSAIITDQLGSSTTIKITSFESIKTPDESIFLPKIPAGSKVEEL